MNKIKSLFTRKKIQKLLPYFFIITAVLIIIFNDVFGDEDAFIEFSFIFFLLMSIWLIWWLIDQIKYILRLKKEKKQIELMHLKSQVNPHFFFNTLNNSYGLVGQDTEKAQQLILKLSDMMRYSIYEGQKDWVTLSEEITYLENYMELHRMRYHKEINIRFDISAEDQSIKIMPLLFIILVENAFKHGVEKLRKDAFVHIRLQANKELVDFEIENNFDVDDVTGEAGIGLKNLEKRLELVYPNKYELEKFSNNGDIYKIRLKLKI